MIVNLTSAANISGGEYMEMEKRSTPDAMRNVRIYRESILNLDSTGKIMLIISDPFLKRFLYSLHDHRLPAMRPMDIDS